MKCNELYRLLRQHGWYPVSQHGSHIKMRHRSSKETIIFPAHGAAEVGKGLERKILKTANIRK